jgi:hypothetical protein
VRGREPIAGIPEVAIDELGWRYDQVGRPDPSLMAKAGYV